ncbi:WG repeat-containing protein [Sphingobacterium sp. LRF_L2]|uniref:WG repeat-containing protein n=1 Tax=Sphingobacterium sp. LRF_L2 TaxID=3369421 RepID=UPI003F6098F4
MRNVIALFFSFSLVSNTFAQEKIFKIDYKLEIPKEFVELVDPTNDFLSSSLLQVITEGEPDHDKPQIEAWVNGQLARISTNIAIIENTQIIHQETGQSFVLYPSLQQYWETSIPANEDNQESSELTENFPITLIRDSTRNIAGYTCKLALVEVSESVYDSETNTPSTINVWYTEKLPSFSWGDYTYLNHIPGAALAIQTAELGMIATNVQLVDFAPQLFVIPENYTIVDTEEYDLTDTPIGHELYLFQDGESDLLGIKDADENEIVEAKYSSIGEFKGDYAVVVNPEGQYGIIDIRGQELFACEWDFLDIDNEQPFILFAENQKLGFMDFQKHIVIPPKYDYLTHFVDGYAIFSIADHSGLINNREQIILPAVYTIIQEYNSQYAIVLENDLYYLVDIKSQRKMTKGYNYLTFANQNNFLLATEEGKYGYITAEGKTVIPFKYTYATPFYDGVASVSETNDGETKYINISGEFVQIDEND